MRMRLDKFFLCLFLLCTSLGVFPPVARCQTGEAAELIRAATAAADAGKLPESIKLYSKALALSPHNSELLRQRGLVRLATHDFKKAYDDFQQAGALPGPLEEAEAFVPQEDDPEHYPDWLKSLVFYQLATFDARQEKYESAIKFYNAALAIRPDFAEAMSDRALAEFILKNYAQAEKDATTAASIRPSYWANWLVIASLLGNRGQFKDAVKAMDCAITTLKSSANSEPRYNQIMKKLKTQRIAFDRQAAMMERY